MKKQNQIATAVTILLAGASFILLVVWIRQVTVGEISFYRVAKTSQVKEDTETGASKLQWQTPPGWQELPGGGMREGSFRVPGEENRSADVSIIRLSGDGGGVAPNVNRWREQMGLQPLSAADIQATLQKVDTGIGAAVMVDLASVDNLIDQQFKARMLAAIIPLDGQTLFVKMTGDDALVGSLKPAFQAFLRTLKIESAGKKPRPQEIKEVILWDVPSNWADEGANGMRKAGYRIAAGNGEEAQLTITALAGDGGGNLANVNRWRGQLGLPPLQKLESEASITVQRVFGADMIVVDITGASENGNPPQRILGGIYFRNGQTWYFKMTGGASAVESERSSFFIFLKSIRFEEE